MNAESQDTELLTAWCAGDDAAGDQLLRSAFPRLYRFFFNKIGDDSSDLIQQTMLACVEHRDRLASCVSFEAYLLRIARNKLYDFLRKRSRSREDTGQDLPSVQELKTSMASLLGRKARDRKILTTLRHLPVNLQVVLELHYWSDLTTSEVAEVLEVPLGTVKTRLRRARRDFEEALKTDGVAADALAIVRV